MDQGRNLLLLLFNAFLGYRDNDKNPSKSICNSESVKQPGMDCLDSWMLYFSFRCLLDYMGKNDAYF